MSDLKKEIERIIAENDIDAYDMKSLRDMADALEAKDREIEELADIVEVHIGGINALQAQLNAHSKMLESADQRNERLRENRLVKYSGVIAELKERIAELESALRQLEMAESEAVRNHVKQALKGAG